MSNAQMLAMLRSFINMTINVANLNKINNSKKSIFFELLITIRKIGEQNFIYEKVKNNSRTITKKWHFSRTFPGQKYSRTIQGIPEPVAILSIK